MMTGDCMAQQRVDPERALNEGSEYGAGHCVGYAIYHIIYPYT